MNATSQPQARGDTTLARTSSQRTALHHEPPPPGRRRPPKEAGAVTDYDAPRTNEDGPAPQVDSLEGLRERPPQGDTAIDEEDTAEGFELPGADLSGEELAIAVMPQQSDEFVCTRCFLVHHRSRLTADTAGRPVCTECAARSRPARPAPAHPTCVDHTQPPTSVAPRGAHEEES